MRGIPIWGTFAVPSVTNASGGTAFAALVPPWRGPSGTPPLIYSVVNGVPNWLGASGATTHLDTLIYTTGAAAHLVGVMRPLNWTTFAAAVPKNTTAITLASDPGKYSTGYNYPTPGGVIPALADNTIATADYVAYQLADGTWVMDTIASGTFGGGNVVLTTGTPNTTGGVINAGQVLFTFGVVSDKDPATGLGQWETTTIASATRASLMQEGVLGGVSALHKGDPLVFYSPNTTAQGWLDHLSGYYSPR